MCFQYFYECQQFDATFIAEVGLQKCILCHYEFTKYLRRFVHTLCMPIIGVNEQCDFSGEESCSLNAIVAHLKNVAFRVVPLLHSVSQLTIFFIHR
jgi:hypothetical protein